MSTRMLRYCDVCGADFSDRPDWMILSAPNAPEQVEAEWDFCSYSCLTQWINAPDEDPLDNAGPDFGVEHDTARTMVSPPAEEPQQRSPEELAAAQKKLDAAMAAMSDAPQMTLMEALASGKLNFNRGPE